MNARLDKLPRFRMQTLAGRLGWNLALRIAELFRALGGGEEGVSREVRRVQALGRSVLVRISRPAGTCSAVLVSLHGGGWTIGNARMNDRRVADWVRRTGFAVVSVDYRLAVHHPISALVDDCEAAALWTIANRRQEFGADCVLMTGESAGAHIAALTLLKLRDRVGALKTIDGVLFSFGLYDLSGSESVRSAGPDTLILHGPTIRTTLCKLTPGMSDAERRSPDLSPVYANLSGLPPALFVVGIRTCCSKTIGGWKRDGARPTAIPSCSLRPRLRTPFII